MAREVRRFLDWYIAERYNRPLHTKPEKAPCHSEFSRRVEGNSETARIVDRRIATQPSLPTPAHEARAGDPDFGTATFFVPFPGTCVPGYAQSPLRGSSLALRALGWSRVRHNVKNLSLCY